MRYVSNLWLSRFGSAFREPGLHTNFTKIQTLFWRFWHGHGLCKARFKSRYPTARNGWLILVDTTGIISARLSRHARVIPGVSRKYQTVGDDEERWMKQESVESIVKRMNLRGMTQRGA
jgi:hypothetical protein